MSCACVTMNVSVSRVFSFIAVYLFVNISATSFETIRIPGPDPKYTAYTVELYKGLEILFENFIKTESISCSFEGRHESLFSDFDAETHLHVLKIPVISDYISTLWKCKTENNITFSFEIRVRKLVNVTVSGEPLTFQLKNHSTGEYDGIYDYSCKVGETVDFTCKNSIDKGEMKLRYYDRYGNIVIETQDYGLKDFVLNFRMLIRYNNFSQSYADCTYLSTKGSRQQEFTYRTVFTVSTITGGNGNGFIVTINDINLTARVSRDDGKERYTYKYSYGQQLNITCAKKNQMLLGDIFGKIIINEKYFTVKEIASTPFKYIASIETTNRTHTGTIFQCYSKFENYMQVANIRLELETGDPLVTGLSAGNILYEYNTGNMEWIVHYLYTVDDVLNLTCCSTNDSWLKWVYTDNFSITNEDLMYKSKYISGIFSVNSESKNITCESGGNSTHRIIIVLHQMQRYHGTAEDQQFNVFEIIGLIAGVLIATVAAVYGCYWRRSNKNINTKDKQLHARQKESNEYTYIENVNNDTGNQDGVMKTSSLYCQNDQDLSLQDQNTAYNSQTEVHYTEIGDAMKDDIINSTYYFSNKVQSRINSEFRKGQYSDNSQREHHYTEITDTGKDDRINITYAVPYKAQNFIISKQLGVGKSNNNIHRSETHMQSEV